LLSGFDLCLDFLGGKIGRNPVLRVRCNALELLSECREEAGAEALSGLARVFFYAGARALQCRTVESEMTVKLMTITFDAIAKNPKLTTAEALRQAMLSTMDDRTKPEWANPTSWAPFVLVGEGGIMTR